MLLLVYFDLPSDLFLERPGLFDFGMMACLLKAWCFKS